jgi:Dolichyl-phosphate-mannose-protein mannosyltransferase
MDIGLTTSRKRWRRPAVWLALALAGQAVALRLLDAGRLVHYQHLRDPRQVWGDSTSRWLLIAVAAQAVFVALGLSRQWTEIRGWMGSRFRLWQVAAILAVCCSVSAAVSRDPGFFVVELSFASALQLINLGNVVMIALTLPRLKLPGWFADRDTEPKIDRFAVRAALWVTIVSAALSWFVYQAHPHVADEIVYLYNARYFAAGQVHMAPPPLQPAFDVDLMEYQPHQWYGVVPPGWPAVLAIGVVAGVPWLVNPDLAGVCVLLAYLLLTELYSRRTARLAVLVLCISPWFLFMGMNFMTHLLTLACALAGFVSLGRARRTGNARWAWLAGAMAGAGSLIRPLDGLIAAGLIGLWAIGLGGRRLKFSSLVALGAGTILMAAANLPYNRALTGSLTRSPLLAYTDEHYGPHSNDYGYGPERGWGWGMDPYPGHTPFESVINAELNGASINTELLGWATGSLILIAIAVFAGKWTRSDRLMLAAIAAVVAAYAPYWFSGGPDFGARYWFLILVPCAALTARGVEALETKAGEGAGSHRVVATVLMVGIVSLINYIPWRSTDKYYHYLNMRPDMLRLAGERHFSRSLVLIRGERFPDYASAAIYNPLDLRGGETIYAWDRSPEVRRQVLKLYPERPVWVIEGPTLTRNGFRIVAGPVPARELAAP